MHEAATDPKNRSSRSLWRRMREFSLPCSLLVFVVTPGAWNEGGCNTVDFDPHGSAQPVRSTPSFEPCTYSLSTDASGARILTVTPQPNANGDCLAPVFEGTDETLYARVASIVATTGDNVGINCKLDFRQETEPKDPVVRERSFLVHPDKYPCVQEIDNPDPAGPPRIRVPKSTDAYVEVTNFKTYGTDALASQAKGYYCGALPTVKIPANTKKLFYCEHKRRPTFSGFDTSQTYAADCYEITGLGL